MFSALTIILIALQPPQPLPKTEHPHNPPHAQWHTFHSRPLVEVNRLLASPVVVVQSQDTVYATVVNGVITQTYRLVPIVAEAPPVVVVPETRYRGFFRWRR